VLQKAKVITMHVQSAVETTAQGPSNYEQQIGLILALVLSSIKA
jgi:hypothetical protein